MTAYELEQVLRDVDRAHVLGPIPSADNYPNKVLPLIFQMLRALVKHEADKAAEDALRGVHS